jgi:hypothetical protein
MTLPARSGTVEQQRQPFRQLRTALDGLRSAGLALDTLSMGMSGDLEAVFAAQRFARVDDLHFDPRLCELVCGFQSDRYGVLDRDQRHVRARSFHVRYTEGHQKFPFRVFALGVVQAFRFDEQHRVVVSSA